MKSLRRILIITIVFCLSIGNLVMVNAASDDVKIEDGNISGNAVTFIATFSNNAVLLGDFNDDAKIDDNDVSEIMNASASMNYSDYEKLAGDIDTRGDGISNMDAVTVAKLKDSLGFQLTGTLAEESTLKVEKISSETSTHKYKLTVTFPNNKYGTIGINLKGKISVGKDENGKDIYTGAIGYSDNTVNNSDIVKIVNINKKEKTTISDGVKDGNKIKFQINMSGIEGLRGDADKNGKIEPEIDSKAIQQYLANIIGDEKVNKVLADFNLNGEVDIDDAVQIGAYNSIIKNIVELTGTLAKQSTFEIVKDSDGNYYIEVTIPEDTKEGTIGVTLTEGVLKNEDNAINEKASSNIFNLSGDNKEEFKVIDEKQENVEDGKIKVTITVNKELDPTKLPDGWTLSEDGKSIWKVMDKGASEDLTLVAKDGSTIKYKVTAGDKTTAPGKIPQTGVKNTMILVVAGIAIVGTVVFIRSRKMLK